MLCYVTQVGQSENVTFRYIGGEGGQKLPKLALRNFWTAPYYVKQLKLSNMRNRPFTIFGRSYDFLVGL